jgi:hypothetical protein
METATVTERYGRGHAPGSKRTQFQPGHTGQPANGNGSPRPSRMLLDMRAVCRQPADKDRNAAQQGLRRLLLENPQAFFARMDRLELEHRQQVAAALMKVQKTASVSHAPRPPAAPPEPTPPANMNLEARCERCKRVGRDYCPLCKAQVLQITGPPGS